MTSQLPDPPAGFQYYQTPVGLQLGPVNQYIMTSRGAEIIPPIHSAPRPSPHPPAPFTFYLPVNSDCVGLIVGSKGRTIKRIQTETGAHVRLNQPDPEKNKTLPSFAISGSSVSVTRAAVKITEIACEAKHRNESKGRSGGSSSTHGHVMPVPMASDFPVLGSSQPVYVQPVSTANHQPTSPTTVQSYSAMASSVEQPLDNPEST